MKNAVIFLCLLGLVFSTGCTASSTNSVADETNRLITATDKLYVAIKTIVTDEDIKTLIDDEDMESLALLEQRYLAAKELLTADLSDADSLLELTDCAESVLLIIGKESLKAKYGTEITAIRLGIKVLINFYAGS